MMGGVVLIREPKQPDALDVRMLVASAVDAFCEEFGLSGVVERKFLLDQIAAQAREMRAEL